MWQSVGANDPITVVQTGSAFLASAQSGFKNATGYVFSNSTCWLDCCATDGILGLITENCSYIYWDDENRDEWSRNPSDSHAGVLSTGAITIGVTAAADGGTAAVSTFFFFAAGANTTNLPPKLSDGDSRAGGTLILLGGADAAAAPLLPRCASPSCEITGDGKTTLTVSGLVLEAPGPSSGALAYETWTFFAPNASAIVWTVNRTFGPAAASFPIMASSFTGLTLQTTGGLPIHSQQIPS